MKKLLIVDLINRLPLFPIKMIRTTTTSVAENGEVGDKVLSQHLSHGPLEYPDLQPKGMNKIEGEKGVGLLSGPL